MSTLTKTLDVTGIPDDRIEWFINVGCNMPMYELKLASEAANLKKIADDKQLWLEQAASKVLLALEGELGNRSFSPHELKHGFREALKQIGIKILTKDDMYPKI